jgi:type II secretory pathway component PulM
MHTTHKKQTISPYNFMDKSNYSLRVSLAGPYWAEVAQRNQVILGTLVVFLLVAGVFPQSYWQLWRWWHGAI